MRAKKGTTHQIMIGMSLWVFALTGCAGSARWTEGIPESLRPYYDQGVGSSRSPEQADRNALIALVAEREGIQVESVTEDSVRSVQTEAGESYAELFTSKGVIRVQGDVPEGAYIAERWQGQSLHWSYALLEKAGRQRAIEQVRRDHLRGVAFKSFVPGWAQFTKGEHTKAWRILTLEGVSTVGATVLGVLTVELVSKGDRTGSDSDWDWYNDWANRCYWGSVGLGALGGITYLASLIDGLASEAKTYKLLLYADKGTVFLSPGRDAVVLGWR
ncbi:MAG: hypothetical protein V1800_00890 [Candidatus Latescibacterota bacterium]